MNGWKVVEVTDAKMMKWLWFVCKRLILKLQLTYLVNQQLDVVIIMSKKIMSIQVHFVNGHVYEKLVMKKKMKKVNTFLCGHYIFLII
jgi:hypothetical protein